MKKDPHQQEAGGPQNRARAATQDILGRPPGTTDVPEQWQEHFDTLEQLRDDFLERKRLLVKDAAEERPSYSMHLADAGTDTYDQDWALSLISSEQTLLFEIEAAMARIKDGTYGVCELTGKTIEPDRLQAVPWTRFSLQAEQQLEAEGKLKRTRLAERGSWNEIATGEETGTEEGEMPGGS